MEIISKTNNFLKYTKTKNKINKKKKKNAKRRFTLLTKTIIVNKDDTILAQ